MSRWPVNDGGFTASEKNLKKLNHTFYTTALRQNHPDQQHNKRPQRT